MLNKNLCGLFVLVTLLAGCGTKNTVFTAHDDVAKKLEIVLSEAGTGMLNVEYKNHSSFKDVHLPITYTKNLSVYEISSLYNPNIKAHLIGSNDLLRIVYVCSDCNNLMGSVPSGMVPVVWNPEN